MMLGIARQAERARLLHESFAFSSSGEKVGCISWCNFARVEVFGRSSGVDRVHFGPQEVC